MRYLYELGFPVGLLAAIGAFAIGMAIFQGDISLNNKRFVLGAFLVSVAISAWHLPKIYAVGLYDGSKIHRFFSFSALVWTLVFGAASIYLARLLLPMLRQ